MTPFERRILGIIEQKPDLILFFDGVCNLCNFWIDFVLRHDKKALLKFAPLQGSAAKSKLMVAFTEDLTTVVLFENGNYYFQSEAILFVLHYLGGGWAILGRSLRIVPRSIRDWVYARVSKQRVSLFGQRSTCRLPTLVERERFLE